MNNRVNVKKNDTVIVLAGKDKGKKGKVLNVDPASRTVIVEGVNMATKHTKPKKQGQPGGIIHQETAIFACKVMHVCNKCGEPTRLGHFITSDGKKFRSCKKCNELFDD